MVCIRFTQPVLVQKLDEEYKPPDGPVSKTPAVAGQVLLKCHGKRAVVQDIANMFMMQWSHLDIFNAV